MRRLIAATIAACLSCPSAYALKDPEPGKTDPKMVTAPYVPGEIYRVHMAQGQTFAVVLSPNETGLEGFGADNTKLQAGLTGNIALYYSGESTKVEPRSLFIISKLPDGTRRVYTLLADTVPPEQAQISLTFTYPADLAAVRDAAWKRAQAERQKRAAEEALTRSGGMEDDSNFAYALQGKTKEDWDLLPTRQVSDNGTDTHFLFPGNMRLPIIYVMNPDGKEALADYTFNSQTGIAAVHQLGRAFHLRDGDTLLCVFNRHFDPIGVRSPTGTTSLQVERVTARQP